jgi:hypothetical protein
MITKLFTLRLSRRGGTIIGKSPAPPEDIPDPWEHILPLLPYATLSSTLYTVD